VLAEVLSYQGRRREALQVIADLPSLGANETLVRGLRTYHRLAERQPIGDDVPALTSAGVLPGQLAIVLAWAGELAAAEKQATTIDPATADRTLYEAITGWRRGDFGAAVTAFGSLSQRKELDYAALASVALGEIAFERARFEEAGAALDSFASMYMTSARGFAIGVPPPELYRMAFAGYFRSAVYPRSLYLSASAYAHLGSKERARKKVE